MKKIIAAGVVILALTLTGCGVKDAETGGATNLTVSVVQTPDGRNITCIKFMSGGSNVGGVTCDWERAK